MVEIEAISWLSQSVAWMMKGEPDGLSSKLFLVGALRTLLLNLPLDLERRCLVLLLFALGV